MMISFESSAKTFLQNMLASFLLDFLEEDKHVAFVIDHGEIPLRYRCPLWHHKGLNSSAKEAKK